MDRLGIDKVTTARNANLLSICQNVRLPNEPGRVVEALATGIPTIIDAAARAGLPSPVFQDSGIGFVALLRRPLSKHAARPKLGASARRVYDALGSDSLTTAETSQQTALAEPNVRRHLRNLATAGLVEQLGGRGRPGTTYRHRSPST